MASDTNCALAVPTDRFVDLPSRLSTKVSRVAFGSAGNKSATRAAAYAATVRDFAPGSLNTGKCMSAQISLSRAPVNVSPFLIPNGRICSFLPTCFQPTPWGAHGGETSVGTPLKSESPSKKCVMRTSAVEESKSMQKN
eukprot:14907050-Alexandrium_andersonii.AAC.1